MKRSALNFTVDLLSFIVLTSLAVTGFIMKFVLPPGSGGRGRALHGGRGAEHIKTLLSMGRHDWGDIHFRLAVIFVVLAAVHIILHYNWIKAYCKSLFRPSQNNSP